MIHLLLLFFTSITMTIPPAAKVLVISGIVYGLIQWLKQAQWAKKYLTGWVAVLLNVLGTILAVVASMPANQLYTMATLYQIMDAFGIAAGIHGTVRSFTQPKVLATIPPDPTVIDTPATLVPNDPTAVPIDEKK